jgi:hypothetical protein
MMDWSKILEVYGPAAPPLLLLLGGIWWIAGDRKQVIAERDKWLDKLQEMLELQFTDAANRKELWDAQAKVIADLTQTIKDMKAEFIQRLTDLRGRQ